MIRTSQGTHLRRRRHLSPDSFRKALAVAACAAAGLIGLAVVPAAAAQMARGASASVPPNQAPRSAAALAFDPAGAGFAFYRGADNAVYMRAFSGSGPAWSAQSRIGGVITGAPAAAVAHTTVVVAVRGADNALWLRTLRNGTWDRWTSWGGVLSASPAIAGGSDGRIDVFVRGTDNALWTRTLRAGGPLTAWKSLGGRLSTGPAAVTIQDNFFDVAAAGTDGAVWMTSTSGGWKWVPVGGRTYNAPAIGYIPQSNGAFLYVRGTDNALWGKGLAAGPVPPTWRKIGGALTDAPTAAGTREPPPVPRTIVGVIGADHALWTTKGGWSNIFTRAWVPVG
jgi:hypothetical protein